PPRSLAGEDGWRAGPSIRSRLPSSAPPTVNSHRGPSPRQQHQHCLPSSPVVRTVAATGRNDNPDPPAVQTGRLIDRGFSEVDSTAKVGRGQRGGLTTAYPCPCRGAGSTLPPFLEGTRDARDCLREPAQDGNATARSRWILRHRERTGPGRAGADPC